VLRIALARDSPAGCPWPRRPLRPLGAGRAGGPGPPPPDARPATPRWRACPSTRIPDRQLREDLERLSSCSAAATASPCSARLDDPDSARRRHRSKKGRKCLAIW